MNNGDVSANDDSLDINAKAAAKLKSLLEINAKFGISLLDSRGIVFVYSPPKVGSTSIVSCLRIFASKLYKIIHMHDENMLSALTNVTNVTVNDVIKYNSSIGKKVYVIDVYRSPIERKMSHFFEHISSYHFNANDSQMNDLDLDKIIKRFNNIFPHIALGDLFLDKYDISKSRMPEKFDFNKKYLLIEEFGVKYIKLKLSDSAHWGKILSDIFSIDIRVLKEYDTSNKTISKLYAMFKDNYKIPENLMKYVIDCPYLKYFYSPEERDKYLQTWSKKQTMSIKHYSQDEYNLYQEISVENVWRQTVIFDHYLDNGCVCEKCSNKRVVLAKKIKNGVFKNDDDDKVVHENAASRAKMNVRGKISMLIQK